MCVVKGVEINSNVVIGIVYRKIYQKKPLELNERTLALNA